MKGFDVHAAVKQLFANMDLQTLFRVAYDVRQQELDRTRGFTGRHAVGRLARAQAKRRKAGKTPYMPDRALRL